VPAQLEKSLGGLIWPILLVLLIAVFLVYDMAFSLFISYYQGVLRKRSGKA
jgi:hypothetical protein